MSGPFLTSRFPLVLCPVCAGKLDAATSVGKAAIPQPERPGHTSMTVCIHCGAVLKFVDDLRLKQMTEQEIKSLTDKEFQEVARVQSAIFYLISKGKH